MGGLLHLVRQGGAWRAEAPPSPLLAVPNVTAHLSMASVPITVLLYDGPLLCVFNVAINGLNSLHQRLRAKVDPLSTSKCTDTYVQVSMSCNCPSLPSIDWSASVSGLQRFLSYTVSWLT